MAVERVGPITWAQQEWFTDLGADEDTAWSFAANTLATFPGEDQPVSQVMQALRDLVGRHDGLRSMITRGPDGRRQEVHGVDGLADVVTVVPEGPAAADAIAAAGRTPVRLDRQWPILVVLCVAGDRVRRIAVVVDHAAIDAWGWRLLDDDLATALAARAAGTAPFVDGPAVEQPVDTATWENGPAGERFHARARRHWTDQYETLRRHLDRWTPSAPVATDTPILHSSWLASARAAAAAETIAAATGIRASAAYLLAFGWAAASVEGVGAIGVQALSANRLSTGTQLSVRKAVMPTPIVVATGTFIDRLTDVATQQLSGLRYANIPAATVADLQTSILGPWLGSAPLAARFNYIDRSIVGDMSNRSLGAENIRFTDPAVQGRVHSDPPRPGGSRHILSVQHDPAGALLTLACHEDTAWCPRMVDMLHNIEDLLVWAARRGVDPAPALAA